MGPHWHDRQTVLGMVHLQTGYREAYTEVYHPTMVPGGIYRVSHSPLMVPREAKTGLNLLLSGPRKGKTG